jgi:uncharacterized protein with PCYCGC motif
MQGKLPRRTFLGQLTGMLGAFLPGVQRLGAASRHWPTTGPHPTPRPGITAAKVLTREQLADAPQLVPVFDQVREIPEVVDGIRCQCGCAELEGYYSLLSCYEGEAMARHCAVCQGQARLAHRLHQDGKTLDEIRSAIDARYGS